MSLQHNEQKLKITDRITEVFILICSVHVQAVHFYPTSLIAHKKSDAFCKLLHFIIMQNFGALQQIPVAVCTCLSMFILPHYNSYV